jgi:hypothetical protein
MTAYHHHIEVSQMMITKRRKLDYSTYTTSTVTFLTDCGNVTVSFIKSRQSTVDVGDYLGRGAFMEAQD